jgi:hypothetical protein
VAGIHGAANTNENDNQFAEGAQAIRRGGGVFDQFGLVWPGT